jgi:hypothetical protein
MERRLPGGWSSGFQPLLRGSGRMPLLQPAGCRRSSSHGAAIITSMQPTQTFPLPDAIARVNRWLSEGRTLWVAIIKPDTTIDGGWGAASAGESWLHVVYQRDEAADEVSINFDLSGATATTGSIWESLTPTAQQQFANFDESLGFALPSGVTLMLLLPAAEEPEH